MSDFDSFMKEVDTCLLSKVGMAANDLSDAPWFDYFTDELEIEAACAYALYDYNDIPFETLESVGLGDYI